MANTQGTIDFQKCSAVVIYDRTSGDIVHIHECWTERGARHPAKRTLEAEALEHARDDRPELDRRSVAAIHLDPRKLEVRADESLRVNVKSKRLSRVKAVSPKVRAVATSVGR